EINNGRPIQYRIYRHSIVCDGWRDTGGQNQYHMNYGWGGSFTTWFSIDSLYCYWVQPDSLCPPMEEYLIRNIFPFIHESVPTLSQWGLIIVTLLLAGLPVYLARKRRKANLA
ncbi:MAG: IPTL-CTERM sorting domain-containing protein, partial [candidate division Zixibacteria bacterium]|nr:IPTL-CTERM sorting domain-containing protein [candidate division Zixibacteria bacterium]